MHPFRQIMEVLTIPIPLQTLVERFGLFALLELFADPSAHPLSDELSFLFVEATDPAAARIVVTVSAKHLMDLINHRIAYSWYFCSPVRAESSRKLQTAEASVQRYRRGCLIAGISPVRAANFAISRAAMKIVNRHFASS